MNDNAGISAASIDSLGRVALGGVDDPGFCATVAYDQDGYERWRHRMPGNGVGALASAWDGLLFERYSFRQGVDAWMHVIQCVDSLGIVRWRDTAQGGNYDLGVGPVGYLASGIGGRTVLYAPQLGVNESPNLAAQFLRLSLSVKPNPFTDFGRFELKVAGARQVSLGIFDRTGRLVRTLIDRAPTVSWLSCTWDGTDTEGRTVGVGVYFARAVATGTCAGKTSDLMQKTVKITKVE
jgi:hypothetical protein